MLNDFSTTQLQLLGYYLAIINVLAFVIYKYDKWQSTRKGNRVSEKNLLLLAFIGGSIGSLFGMYFLQRHKTNKPLFKWGVPLIMSAQIGIALYSYFK